MMCVGVFVSLLGILSVLRESAMERFLTTPFEEREKAEQSKSLNARLAANQSVISKLEKELADANAERDAEVSRKSSEIISSICFGSTCAFCTSVLHFSSRQSRKIFESWRNQT